MSERSPLHEATSRAGAVFGEEAGWTMPLHYGDPAAEYRRAREAVLPGKSCTDPPPSQAKLARARKSCLVHTCRQLLPGLARALQMA